MKIDITCQGIFKTRNISLYGPLYAMEFEEGLFANVGCIPLNHRIHYPELLQTTS